MNAFIPRVRIGIAGLDNILHGGLLPNRLYLVEGEPGSGKTTFGLQFLLEGVRSGESCLYVTLSESREELAAGAESHGWSMDGIEVLELAADETALEMDAQVTMYNPSEIELTETIKTVLQRFEAVRPSRMIFDSLSELRLLSQGSLRYRRQILALKQFFIGKGCTVVLLDDGTSGEHDMQLRSIAHGVIRLEQLSPEYGAERRRLRIVKLRGTSYRGGYHDFILKRGGLDVFPRLIAAEHRRTFVLDPIASGIPALDAILGGGPHRGTSTLLIGPAGSGKSTVATQFALAAAARGDRAVVFAFDEAVATHLQRAAGLGLPLQAAVDDGRIRIEPIDPAELSPGELAHRIRQSVEVDDARVIVLDSLNGYLNAMPEEHFLTAQLHELLSYLGAKGVTTMLVVAQHGLIGTAMETPVDTSYLADSVILFRYIEIAGRVRKAISVVKKRSGRHEESIRELLFSEKGVALSAPLEGYRGLLTGVPIPLGLPSQ